MSYDLTTADTRELSFEELDLEMVEVLPPREEMLFNANVGVGANQAGLANLAIGNVGVISLL